MVGTQPASSATEASLHRFLSEVWSIKREKQEAAREQAIRDTIAREDDRARWEQFAPTIQQNSGRATEYTELQ